MKARYRKYGRFGLMANDVSRVDGVPFDPNSVSGTITCNYAKLCEFAGIVYNAPLSAQMKAQWVPWFKENRNADQEDPQG